MALHISGISAGEIGGTFAGLVTLLVTIGGAVRWLVGWRERRAATLHAKLVKWEEKLEQREARLDAEQAGHIAALERRIGKVEEQNAALRNSYYLVSAELRASDPFNLRLRQADEILRRAFPLDPLVPPDMDDLLKLIPKEGGADNAASK